MNRKDLLELISKGESSTLEFKRKISSFIKIAKEISAFANTIGGYLLIGIDDDGSIIGVESEKGDIYQVLTTCEFYIDPPVIPDIEIVGINGKDIIVVYIEESKIKPHKLNENPDEKNGFHKTYIRVGEKSVVASREMVRVLAGMSSTSKPITLSIGDKEKRLFSYLDIHERSTVKDFARLVNISDRRSERLLVRLVRAGVLQIHVDSNYDYFTLIGKL
jgi:predicted HTH transcriptional regulator